MIAIAMPARFAAHELRLAWRDVMGMLTAGKRSRQRAALVVVAVVALIMHGFAYAIVAPYARLAALDRETLVVVSGVALLSWTLMLSQAMESVTRAFFARADLDLLLSSPVSAPAVFALRVAAIAASTIMMAALLVSPFVNVLVALGGWRWLAAYGVVAAMGAAAVALALGLTALLFATLGARRTRLVAQIVAAIVGAAFAVGVQIVSIFSYGNLSRIAALHSEVVLAFAPASDSFAWLPARGAMGDWPAFGLVALGGFALLALVTAIASTRFARYATAAAGLAYAASGGGRARTRFRAASSGAVLRRKEWMLLARDPWLTSQTLMQLFYLLPPALLLWKSFEAQTGSLVLLAPVLVMAAGQLAGGLAWLAISGEDAPDLVATAPVSRGAVLRAKIEAVGGAIALPVLPFVAAIAFASPWIAIVTLVFAAASAASATAIQIVFRAQAKRSHFRRRQTSSRAATFAEALSSINWAATAALAAAGTWLAVVFAIVSLLILAGARLMAPRRDAGA